MKKKQHIKDIKPAVPKPAVGQPVKSASGRIPKVLVIGIMLTVGILIYANSFHNEFVFDDKEHVVNNTAIRSLGNIPAIFTHHLTYFGGGESKFYRPVETLTFMANYAMNRLDPFGYHVMNTALHMLVCILLFYLLSYITGDTMIAAVASVIYLVHPVHTEAVAYVSGRADSIVSIFLLLMAILQYKSWSAGGVKKALYYLGILICFAMALLTKESAVSFPFLLAFFEYCLRKKEGYSGMTGKRLVFYLPLIAMIGIWLFMKNRFVSTEAMVIMQTSLATRLATLPRVIANYLRISFLPVGLHMEYRYPFTTTVFAPGYTGPLIFVVALMPLVYYIWRRGTTDINFRIMFFGLGWFFVALLPYFNIFFQLNAAFSEHWLYIPLMGLALFVAYGAFYLAQGRKQAQVLTAALFVCAVAVFSVTTIRQNTVWKNNIVFFEYTIQHAPHSPRAYNNLALEYAAKGDLPKAVELFEKAVEVDPQSATAAENLRNLKRHMGE